MKNNKILLILLLSGALLIALAVYAAVRTSQISVLKRQLIVLDSKSLLSTDNAGVNGLKAKFPEKADVSSFVESLYTLAQTSGLENVEITTTNETKTRAVAKNRSTGQNSASLLVPFRVKISCEGKYRTIARYLGQMHDIKRYNNVVSFDMKPGENTIKANIIVEIMSFEVQNAS